MNWESTRCGFNRDPMAPQNWPATAEEIKRIGEALRQGQG